MAVDNRKVLEEALDVTGVCVRMLQDEMISNAQFKGKIEQAISTIEEKLDTIHSLVVSGTTHNVSLVERVRKLECDVSTAEKRYDDDKEEGRRTHDRFWEFFSENIAHIITWAVLAALAAFQFLSQKHG